MKENLDEFRLAAWRAFLTAHAAVIDLIEHELAEAQATSALFLRCATGPCRSTRAPIAYA